MSNSPHILQFKRADNGLLISENEDKQEKIESHRRVKAMRNTQRIAYRKNHITAMLSQLKTFRTALNSNEAIPLAVQEVLEGVNQEVRELKNKAEVNTLDTHYIATLLDVCITLLEQEKVGEQRIWRDAADGSVLRIHRSEHEEYDPEKLFSVFTGTLVDLASHPTLSAYLEPVLQSIKSINLLTLYIDAEHVQSQTAGKSPGERR